LCIAFSAALVASAAQAQPSAYPSKPVRIVVPFSPGGSSELVARTFAQKLSENLGQQFYLENKPGGAGNIATAEVAHAQPDGYTLIVGHIGTFAVNPAMFGDKLPYDPIADFAPVSLLVQVPTLFVVNASVPAKDLREFIALAKAKPGQINYGSAGNGSAGHLAFEYLKMVVGIDVVHVPYKGTGPQIIDLLAGQVQASAAGTGPFMPHVRSGKLRAIAVGTPKRISALPDVGTVAEQGYPGFETSQWYGFLAPARTPAAIVHKLSDEIAKTTRSPDLEKRFEGDSMIVVGSTPEAFGTFIRSEMARWGEVVRKAGIKAE
jgi:tripartite-type tricarboxylate transporter receptor subunit TctC